MMSMWQVPAVVMAFLAWLAAPPNSLGELSVRESLRRQSLPQAARVYTNHDLPAPPAVAAPPATTPPVASETGAEPAKPSTTKPAESAPVKHDEAWWRDRITKAREALGRDQMLAAALQSQINALTSDAINRDDPVQKARLFEQRQKTIDELDRQMKTIEADQKDIQAILDDAKKSDVPVGWIR